MRGYNLLNLKFTAISNYVRGISRFRPVALFLLGLIFVVGLTTETTPPVLANRGLPTDLSYSTETRWLLPGLPNLSAAAGYIPHNFSNGEAIFDTDQGPIHGFRAGKAYSEMSLRHLAWSLETAQYYYPDEYLREPIEAYLRRQSLTQQDVPEAGFAAERGAVGNMLRPDGQLIKQSQTSDEETSLIHAAYLYYNMTYNAAWLRKEINGLPVIDRLNLAADWLYTHRFDQHRQLLWRNGPRDWGSPAETDQSFRQTTSSHSVNNQRIVALYDQALAYLALIELARMNAAAEDTAQADLWQNRAEALKTQVKMYFWGADQGIYRHFAALSPTEQVINQVDQVSITNALAIYSGLTEPRQNRPILERLEWARLQAEAKKPGLSIYPYPSQTGAGLGYQGGIWDWWGGLQIKAEFLSGFSETAQMHLLQVANEWQNHPGNIIEWQSVTNPDQEGSHYDSAAAGTVGGAIIEGFFGIQLTGQGLTLSPRLGLNDGFIRVYQPATDRYGAYSYDWNQNVTRIAYGTNAKGSVQINVLKLRSEQIRDVLIDDRSVTFEIQIVEQDAYISFEAPSGQHHIKIIKGQPPAQLNELENEPGHIATPLAIEGSTPSVAPNAILPRAEALAPEDTIDRDDSSFMDFPRTLAAQNARRSWLSFLHFISFGFIILTALTLIVVVALRRLKRFGPY